MVEIANPIYDVVFKYLMNDEKVAKLLLSAIIGREVVSLEFRPTEHHFPVGELLAVLRMDFSARIVDENGEQELVIIELQKAKLASDIMRFRRYLGEQYANKENMVREPAPEYPYRKALPILSIYFLGHTLEHTKAPVVRVNRHYIDAATGEQIREKEEFIESLTHDSIIIQIPYLKGHRRTELEQLLALFDQSGTTDDPHFIAVNEHELPERYRPLLRRLQKAIADPTIRQSMDAEDDLIEEIKDYQRLISEKERIISEKERTISEKERTISEKERTISEKERTISEKERTISEKEQAMQESQKIISEQRKHLETAIWALHRNGSSVEEMASMFGLSTQEIADILSSK
ncbi:MAG: hypothetical protein KF734_15605 [Saprospiraceae bacterium]|nr:hypothetical protein [Saprospiraceae bacterium]